MRNGIKSIVATVLLVLAGCAGVPQAPTSAALDLGADKTFSFKKTDADGNQLSATAVPNALEQAIYATSGYKRLYEQYSSDHIYDVKGLEVTRLPSAIRVSYVNGERYADTGHTYVTRSSATFAYTIEEGPDALTVKISPPKQIETVKQSSPIFLPYGLLASEDRLTRDLRRIYNNLSPVVQLNKWVSGEVDAAYGVDAITANFQRKCRSFAARGQGATTCFVDSTAVDLQIMPYKAGSKVSYKFLQQYRLPGDGSTTYSAESTNQVAAAIERIVKD